MIPSEAQPGRRRAHGSSCQHVEAVVPEIKVACPRDEDGQTKGHIGQWEEEGGRCCCGGGFSAPRRQTGCAIFVVV